MTFTHTKNLYWHGNAAKARVIREIINRSGGEGVVFDYGAGTGGDWPQILADYPGLQLIAFEPHAPSAVKLHAKLVGSRARVLEDMPTATVQADFIVSFSVFEHVFDRAGYLNTARRCLKPGGVIFLNYDDGHFRQACELSQPGTWPAALAEHLRNVLAPLWPMVGKPWLYQTRVTPNACDELLAQAGLAIAGERYENLRSLKNLAKTMPKDKAQEFTRFWLDVEDRLNVGFRVEASPVMNDTVNLWREMASRTLELKATNDPPGEAPPLAGASLPA